MILDSDKQDELKKELVECLRQDPEIKRIVIFGSFLNSTAPDDLDVAIFQDSKQAYLPLAMKYRRQTRSLAKKVPLDIIPIRPGAENDFLIQEIEEGETIYER